MRGRQATGAPTSLILAVDELGRLKQRLDRYPWYRATFERFRSMADELDERRPVVPVAKGRAFFESCENCATRLTFDPYDQSSHVCPKCGREHSGEAFDLAWLRQFHDWLGKRLVEAGIVHQVTGDRRYADLVRHYLSHYVAYYRDYPLANNLLGPTRLFQSTYLEAFWLVDVVAAFDLTRDSAAYSDADLSGVRDLLYESASVVRSYDEGRSNRQAFNNAGMGAVGLLFEDDELISHVLTGPHGFEFHMRESVLEDGVWYEGENYHFATLDHTLNLAEMARHRGIDLYGGGSGHGSLKPMFDGPLKVLLPDLTFPSRKDSWFGRGMEFHRHVYELGYARYGDERYGGLLAGAYASGVNRGDLSWRTFLYLEPDLPEAKGIASVRQTGNERMPGTGVAVLRRDAGATYASVEYGRYGGGHGHPDRLHLTLFADGVHWLLDPGTGWYHVPELGWYRSTIAHNTVSVDGRLQQPREGRLVAFGEAAGLQVAQATVEDLAPGVTARRTLVLGPGFLFDALDVLPEGPGRRLDWAFSTVGRFDVAGEAAAPVAPIERVAADELGQRDGYEFLRGARQASSREPDLVIRHGDAALRVVQLGDSSLYLAEAPGVPGREEHALATLVARRELASATSFVTAWVWSEARDGARFYAEEDGLAALELGGDVYSFYVTPFDRPSASGVGVTRRRARAAVGRSSDAPLDVAAWFALAELNMPGAQVAADRALPYGAVVRDEGGAWTPELPSGFGSVRVSTDVELRYEQPPGVELWLEADEGPALSAGLTNEVRVYLGWYGLEPEQPDVTLPAGWHLEGMERSEPSGRAGHVHVWRLLVAVPSDAAPGRGGLEVSVADRAFTVPYRVGAPLSTAWRVSSIGGGPRAVLEVSDRGGAGGELAYSFEAPWLTEPRSGEATLPPGGRAELTLELPLEQPEAPPGSAGPRETVAPAGSATGADDLEVSTVPDRVGELPGVSNTAGKWQLAARLDMGGFSGKTVARLPLLWAGSEPGTLRLDRAEQALWADRPWGGVADASAEATVALTPDGVRLECSVTDDRHVTDANADDPYENDSLQVYFDFREDHHGDRSFAPGVAAYILAPSTGKDAVTVRQIAGNREISNRGASAAWFTTDGVVATCEAAPDGYLLEAYFPYASLGVEPPRRGDVLGFDLSLSDNDGTWYRNTQMLWSGSRGRRCYIRGSYHDPREFGWLVVGELERDEP